MIQLKSWSRLTMSLLISLITPTVSLAYTQAERDAIIEEQMNEISEQMASDPKAWSDLSFSSQYETETKKAYSEIDDRTLDSVADKHTDYYDEEPVSAVTEDQFIKTNLSVQAGYRKDEINWNIADTDGTPNILSELTWRDLHIYQVKHKGNAIFGNHLVADWGVGYGWIADGENQDSDFAGNDRTLEFSRSDNKSEEGDVRDFSAAVGWRFDLTRHADYKTKNVLNTDVLAITPLVGYSYHEQNLVMTDGNQTIPASGAFPGLHSTYETEWDGPWTGIDVTGQRGKLKGALRFEYHFVDYYAEADWNLRTDFQHPKSFDHVADGGRGLVFVATGGYLLNPNWSLDAEFTYQDWQMESGIDTTYFSDGTTLSGPLNEVNWESFALSLGTSYHF